MNSLDDDLNLRLADLKRRDLYRELRRVDSAQSPRIDAQNRTYLNFSSNDYLGLANDPVLKAAAAEAVARYGAGSGASRLICGSLAPHHELEQAIANFKGTEAALSFSSGYTAALGALGALLGKEDIVIIDKLVHACIVDAARLSGAKLRVFSHNDLSALEHVLKWASQRRQVSSGRVLIVTESIFSMDGDHAPLREIVELKEKYGAWLMLDEAHATGLYGAHRRGLAEELGVSDGIEVQMGTLGKALGASGGYICGSKTLIDFLVNRARTFIFSTAPVPAASAAAMAGIQILQSAHGAERCQTLWQRREELETAASQQQIGSTNPTPGITDGKNELPVPASLHSAILPILIGDESEALAAAAALRDRNLYLPAIRYPTVARGSARLRLTLTAAHTADDIRQLFAALTALDLVSRLSLSSSRGTRSAIHHASAG